MPLSLNDFRAISNGKYNAGQIDFKTNRHGEVAGLKKVNNHVHMTGKTAVVMSLVTQEASLAAIEVPSVALDREGRAPASSSAAGQRRRVGCSVSSATASAA